MNQAPGESCNPSCPFWPFYFCETYVPNGGRDICFFAALEDGVMARLIEFIASLEGRNYKGGFEFFEDDLVLQFESHRLSGKTYQKVVKGALRKRWLGIDGGVLESA